MGCLMPDGLLHMPVLTERMDRKEGIMKYVKQFMLILFIAFLGEILHYFLPLPIPASIYGLLILLAALLTGVIRLDMVKETGKLLIEIMPIMFIPSSVGLLESWGALQEYLVPVIVISVVSTILVMGVSGQVTQWIIRKKEQK